MEPKLNCDQGMRTFEFIERLTTTIRHLFPPASSIAVSTISGELMDAFSDGRRIEIKYFGRFEVNSRALRVG